jgi:peptidyl-tRNA hydrolase, PTH1 family
MAFLVVGLGNPGKEYDKTRHNIGFAVADLIAEKLGAVKVKTKLLASATRAKSEGSVILILKPETFMNLSGTAVVPFAKTKKVPMKNIIVVHDELDLPFGETRLSVGAGAAGHNGVKSLIDSFGGKNFARLRVGIGPRPATIPADKFVLARFTSEETAELPKIIENAATATLAYFAAGAKNNAELSD